MDRLPGRRRQHRVGVDAVPRHPRRSDPAWIEMLGALPQPRAQSPHSGPGRSHNWRHPARTGDVSIESLPRNSAGRTHIHGHQDPHRQPERAAARSRPRKIRTAGRTIPRPRPPSVPPAANGPRRLPSPVAAIRASVPFASTPVGWNSRAWRMGRAGLDRQGGDIGDLHSPGCPARCSGKPHERFTTGDRGH